MALKIQAIDALEWRPEYETGMPSVDREHRQLVRLLNELNRAIRQGKNKQVLTRTFNQLASCTVTHYRFEESIRRAGSRTAVTDHRRTHRKLIAELCTVQQNLRSGRLTITLETFSLLRRWLQAHILEENTALPVLRRVDVPEGNSGAAVGHTQPG